MNNSVGEFIRQNITNQGINSDSKIKKIIGFTMLFIFIGFLIFAIIYANEKLKKVQNETTGGKSAEDRVNLGLEVYKNYFNMNQLPIPDNGIYFNIFYNQKKYYGLRDFFYASSYKSYLPCGYTDDVVSYNAIRSVILNGARVIHLDIFHSGISQYLENSKVIVGNIVDGKLTYFKETKDQKPVEHKHYLIFENCLKIVYDLAWTKVNTPFFIYLNMEFLPDQNFENKMFNIIRKILAERFLDKYYGFQRVNLGNIPIGKAMDKVILMTNRRPLDPMLNEIINGVMAPSKSNVILHTITNNSLQYGGVKTIAVSKQIVLDQTMYNLVAVIKKNDTNPENEKIMKIDTKNYDTSYNFELGISMTFMNWQNYEAPKEPTKSTTSAQTISTISDKKEAPKNDFMYDYLLRFKNGGIILKPKELIFIPKPPPPVLKPNPKLDYKQVSYTGFGGFQTTTL
jgi:large-conductance mechanosensitive channel